MDVLPAIQTLGTLSHRTLVLELPSFTQQEVDAARSGQRECEAARIVAHELTHWFDIVGTVWGQTYLDGLFQAYDAVLRSPTPAIAAFPTVLNQFDAERAILFPSYFKFVKPEATPRAGPGTWEMETTSGVRFKPDGRPDEDNPILFVRFHEGGREIARQPISVGALLELRAIGSEVSAYGELRGLRPSEEGRIEEYLYQKHSLQQFYDPQLITYSAAAHLLSNAFAGVADGTAVMMLGPRLAEFALNVTPTHFMRLEAPSKLQFMGSRRLRGFRSHTDRGFLYGCFCFLFRDLGPNFADNHTVLDVLLRKAGLPTTEPLYDAATRYVEQRRPSQFSDPDLRRIRMALQQAGLAILGRRRTGQPIRTGDWANLPSPRIMDRDAETFHLGPETLTEADVDFLDHCSRHLDAVTRAALRAVRGLDFGFTDFVY